MNEKTHLSGKRIQTSRLFHLSMVFGVGLLMLVLLLMLAKRSDAARADFYRLQSELESYRKAVWRLEKLDPKQLEWQLARMNGRFPSSEQLGIILGEITELAKNYGISITSITPSDRTEARTESQDILSVLDRIPIEMQLHGSYERLAGFMSQLGNLENGVMRVDRFRLETEGAQGQESLVLSLSTSLFVRQALEQEVLKEALSKSTILERKAGKSRFAKMERNPFTKTAVQSEVASPVVLQGIIYDPKQPIALVNGETKSIGDEVGGMKILEIEPDSVLFEKDGQEIKMRLRWD